MPRPPEDPSGDRPRERPGDRRAWEVPDGWQPWEEPAGGRYPGNLPAAASPPGDDDAPNPAGDDGTPNPAGIYGTPSPAGADGTPSPACADGTPYPATQYGTPYLADPNGTPSPAGRYGAPHRGSRYGGEYAVAPVQPGRRPGTAVWAAVGGYLGAVAGLLALLPFLAYLFTPGGALFGLALGTVVVLLAAGATLILQRRLVGRYFLTAGCAFTVASALAMVIALVSYAVNVGARPRQDPPPLGGDWNELAVALSWVGVIVLVVLVIVPAVLTAALALAPSTKGWLVHG